MDTMSSIQSTYEERPTSATAAPAAAVPIPAPQAIGAPLLLLLAAAAGVSVASLYYSQPMLGLLGADMQASASTAGWVPTLTQLGYALGILLLAPLGDRYDRRRIILVKAVALVGVLLASGLAPGMGSLLAASLGVGLAATMAQDVVPAAATLAPAAQRGRMVGTVMTGLLLGILLSRVVSGLVAQLWGWRNMYLLAASAMAVLVVAVWRGLPHFAPTTQLGWLALMRSMWELWRQHAALRRAALAQGLLAVGFSAFWSTLAVMLHSQFQLGAAAAGALGLAGAAGALAAPLAGRMADRRGPELVTRAGAALAAAAFASMATAPWLGAQGQLLLIVAAAVVFDFGVQAVLVAHQTIVYGIAPEARSRLNALLFTGMFVGMAGGAALGSWVLDHAGWLGVVALATVSALAALAVRCWPHAR